MKLCIRWDRILYGGGKGVNVVVVVVVVGKVR